MSISVTPLSEAIGAEIVGVDLSLPVSDSELQTINSAIEKYLVIVVRAQRFSPKSLLSAVGLFGLTEEVRIGPMVK